MKNFKDVWKNLAHTKSISAKDMVAFCILKTIAAKSEAKEEVFKYFLGKAFSAGKICQSRKHPFQAVRYAAIDAESDFKYRSSILGKPILEFLETNEEIELYGYLLKIANDYGRM